MLSLLVEAEAVTPVILVDGLEDEARDVTVNEAFLDVCPLFKSCEVTLFGLCVSRDGPSNEVLGCWESRLGLRL